MFKKTTFAIVFLFIILFCISCGRQISTKIDVRHDIHSNEEGNNLVTEQPENKKPVENELDQLFILQQKINESLPEYTFKFYGDSNKVDMHIKKIEIINENFSLIQEILLDGARAPNYVEDYYGMEFVDANFDGYKDLMIQGLAGSGSNITFFFWLWDKEMSTYIKNEELSQLINPEIDEENMSIKSSSSSSAGAYYTGSIYKYIDGKHTLTQELNRTVDMDKKIFHYTLSELQGNNMVIVKEYDKTFDEELDELN